MRTAGPSRRCAASASTSRRGEFVTLVGPSGCGKSTLLNMTAGLLRPTTGAVRYGGAEIAGVNLSAGYMTQSDHLLPWRTVAGNIAGAARDQGARRARRCATRSRR